MELEEDLNKTETLSTKTAESRQVEFFVKPRGAEMELKDLRELNDLYKVSDELMYGVTMQLYRHQTTITTMPHPGFYEGCVIVNADKKLMKIVKVIDNHTITVKKMNWVEIATHYILMFFTNLFRKAQNLLCRWSA